LKISLSGESTIFGPASWMVEMLGENMYPELNFWLCRGRNIQVTILQLFLRNLPQLSVKDCSSCLMDNPKHGQHTQPTINQSFTLPANNAPDDILTTS
jgi:hypothetical protein